MVIDLTLAHQAMPSVSAIFCSGGLKQEDGKVHLYTSQLDMPVFHVYAIDVLLPS